MFVIDGIDKVREVIRKNRERKLTKHKKLSNNSIIEIGSCSPVKLLKLQTRLKKIAEQENIQFVHGIGILFKGWRYSSCESIPRNAF